MRLSNFYFLYFMTYYLFNHFANSNLILLAKKDCESKLSQLNVNIDYTYFEINSNYFFTYTFCSFLDFYNNLELLFCKTSSGFIFNINVVNINF